MKRLLVTTLLMLVAASAWAQPQSRVLRSPVPEPEERDLPRSLWTATTVSEGSLIKSDPRPIRSFRKEEIITIVIREESAASTEATLDTEESNNLNFSIPAFSRIIKNNRGPGFLVGDAFNGGTPNFDIQRSTTKEGDGSMERGDRMTARIAARVIDVKPNGNLTLEARREIQLNGETRVITLTGFVSPRSVSPQNTVFSYDIASARITYTSTGPVSDATRRGWLLKLADFLDPL